MPQRTRTTQPSLKLVALFAALLLPALLVAQGAGAQAPAGGLAAGPISGRPSVVVHSLKNDLSPALRDLAPLRPQRTAATAMELPVRPLPQSAAALEQKRGADAAQRGRQPDPVWQAAAGTLPMAPPLMQFAGLSNDDNLAAIGITVAPPDTAGAIGPNHYVQWVNLVFQIWEIDRSTNSSTPVYGPAAGNSLWQGFGGPCEEHNDGDVIVLYDRLAGRWLMSQFALFAFDGYHQCIAISQTDDPTGAWYRYDFLASEFKINDYPKFGVWPDGYYMSANQFDSWGWAGQGAWVFERSQMLAGAPARMIYYDLYAYDPNLSGMLPADLDGFTLTPGTPNYFVTFEDDALGGAADRLQVWAAATDWAAPENSTFLPGDFLDVAGFNSVLCPNFRGQCIPQPDDGPLLESLSDRLMYRLQFRDFGAYQAMVVNHSVDADGSGRAGLRWYELRRSGGPWAIEQQGTYAPADGLHRWMGSAALDARGNLAIGYSAAGTAKYPSIRYTGRLAADPPGTLLLGEVESAAGVTAQVGTARWGDYSMVTLDPLDDCTFWFTTEYVAGLNGEAWGNWSTQVVAFRYPTCGAGPAGTLEGSVRNASGEPLGGATVVLPGGIQTVSDGAGFYRIVGVPAGPTTVTARKFGYLPSTQEGVMIGENASTVVDFALPQAPIVTLNGQIRDGVHNWPLYARIDITSEESVAVLFTNPVTGAYTVDLVEGAEYRFVVRAHSPGYLPEERAITAGGVTSADFLLLPDPSNCVAPGYTTAGGSCDPLPGGLVTGNVYDGNTSLALDGATVSSDMGTVKTVATPLDPAVDDGFYTLFAAAGNQPITAGKAGGYQTVTEEVPVVADAAAQQSFQLPAAVLSLTPQAFDVALELGQTATQPLTLRNSGQIAAAFELGEQGGVAAPLQPQPGAPLLRLRVPVSAGPPSPSNTPVIQRPLPRPHVPPWTDVAPYPLPIMDNTAAVYDGKVYSVGGYDGFSALASLQIYDPATNSWRAGASMNYGRAKPAAAFIDGLLYVVGGWDSFGDPIGELEIYNPETDLWQRGASHPGALAASGGVSLEGVFYVIGGCDYWSCGHDNVYRYDPAVDSWVAGTPFPRPVGWPACGVLAGQILCAGGFYDGEISATFSYDPATDSWTQRADMPAPTWAAASAVANQRLWVTGGASGATVVNATYAYDPTMDTWSAEANANVPTYRSAGACGLYKIGGANGSTVPTETVEHFPDLTDCSSGGDVPWLSTEPASGRSEPQTELPIAITFDARAESLGQPGQYRGQIFLVEDTPYRVEPVAITMTVTAPPAWGVVEGTVNSLGYCDGSPASLGMANLLLQGGDGAAIPIPVDRQGYFRRWLDGAAGPYTLFAAAPQHLGVQLPGIAVTAQATTTVNVDLRLLAPCISAAPASIGVTLVPGETGVRTLTLRNAGAGEAAFRIGEVEMVWAAAARTAQAVQGKAAGGAEQNAGKGTAGSSVAAANRAGRGGITPLRAGGPDDAGYTYRDSRELTGPAYAWLEIAPPAGGSGVEIAALTGADDVYYWPVTLPFAFPFYDGSYTQLAISSNGTIYFQDQYMGYVNQPMPGGSGYGVDRFIAHFWSDLLIQPGAIYYQDFGQFVVIEYYQVSGVPQSPDAGTWQVVLFPSGSILVQYQDVIFGDRYDRGGAATVGVQGSAWGGLEYTFNSHTLSNRLAICFAPRGQTPTCRFDVPWLTQEPGDGIVAPDGTLEVSVGFNASLPQTNQPNDYDAKLVVAHNDAFVSPLSIPVRMSVVTPTPTLTPRPTDTPLPEPTISATPTNTPKPTKTPKPTRTPKPQADATAEIDPILGGRLVYNDGAGGGIVVDVPPGAVATPVTLVYNTVEFAGGTVGDMVFAGRSFQIDAQIGGQVVKQMAFARPVSVSVIYDPSAVSAVGADKLALYVEEEGEWVDAATTCSPMSTYRHDAAAHMLRVDICHLSEYALFAGGMKVYLPEIGKQ